MNANALVDRPDAASILAAARLGGVTGTANVAYGRAVLVVVTRRSAPTPGIVLGVQCVGKEGLLPAQGRGRGSSQTEKQHIGSDTNSFPTRPCTL